MLPHINEDSPPYISPPTTYLPHNVDTHYTHYTPNPPQDQLLVVFRYWQPRRYWEQQRPTIHVLSLGRIYGEVEPANQEVRLFLLTLSVQRIKKREFFLWAEYAQNFSTEDTCHWCLVLEERVGFGASLPVTRTEDRPQTNTLLIFSVERPPPTSLVKNQGPSCCLCHLLTATPSTPLHFHTHSVWTCFEFLVTVAFF